ncbi:hypothetical protein BSL82_10605 [Tardibacter chloracetimidivorans]|uniref:Uncharacterized protein n=1 Tax=Tardibacter chloracetimidivorans TaxID=1921510 RepID=A0A1L3ZVQ7_9SPHN|nr:hypothetical protein [Tardibacter chloracetimidivorans]API59712.1 hypothetical protein BSL82_10605 [Tardibacter chloracetimidivorans]
MKIGLLEPVFAGPDFQYPEFSAKKQIKVINEVTINELISRSGVVDLSMLQRIAVAFQAF